MSDTGLELLAKPRHFDERGEHRQLPGIGAGDPNRCVWCNVMWSAQEGEKHKVWCPTKVARKALERNQSMIRKEGDKYVLRTKDGKRVLGRHPTKGKAVAQEKAIQKSKRGGGRKK